MLSILVYSRDNSKIEDFQKKMKESLRYYKTNKNFGKYDSIKEIDNRFIFKCIINPKSDFNLTLELDLDKYDKSSNGLDIRFFENQ